MIYYICQHCEEPAFYLNTRRSRGEHIYVEDIDTDGTWIPKINKPAQCQACKKVLEKLYSDKVMDNLEYVEYLAKKKNLI